MRRSAPASGTRHDRPSRCAVRVRNSTPSTLMIGAPSLERAVIALRAVNAADRDVTHQRTAAPDAAGVIAQLIAAVTPWPTSRPTVASVVGK